jgi:hypothetical protein
MSKEATMWASPSNLGVYEIIEFVGLIVAACALLVLGSAVATRIGVRMALSEIAELVAL